jgi:hypothetical protein
MKIQVLNANTSVDSLNIQKRSAFLIFEAVLRNVSETEMPQQETRTDYQSYQEGFLSELKGINVSIKMTGSKSTYHVVQNFNLLEIAKISQNLGFPIVAKIVGGELIIQVCLPFTLGRKSIDFTSKNALQLSCKNESTSILSIYSVDSHVTDNSGILRFEKDTIIANQYTDYKNENQNLIVAVFPNLFEIDVRSLQGQNCPYLPAELDTMNDLNGYGGLIWNNEIHSNFANMVTIPMQGVEKLSVLGTTQDELLYLVRQINFN